MANFDGGLPLLRQSMAHSQSLNLQATAY